MTEKHLPTVVSQHTKLIKAVSTNISLLNKFLAVKTEWTHEQYCEWWDSLPEIWQNELFR